MKNEIEAKAKNLIVMWEQVKESAEYFFDFIKDNAVDYLAMYGHIDRFESFDEKIKISIKKIVEKFDGSIEVKDNKPKGAIFIIKLKK